jgi:hypothetical protein
MKGLPPFVTAALMTALKSQTSKLSPEERLEIISHIADLAAALRNGDREVAERELASIGASAQMTDIVLSNFLTDAGSVAWSELTTVSDSAETMVRDDHE